jgi:8-oxo-dGTP pyrophosphatase MutT (NUDIX family)
MSLREAATVVLLRDAAAGLETWLLRRVPKMAFAPGMSVFPGGAVEESDFLNHPRLESIAQNLGTTVEHAGAIVAAAIRETVEEVDVVLGADAIFPWARWITPEAEPRRYDTYFFVAALPEGAAAAAVTTEASHADWIGVHDALAEYRRGERPMLPPTVATLTEISRYSHATDVVQAAAGRQVKPVQPVLRKSEDGVWVADFGNGNVIPLPAGFRTDSGTTLS